MQRGIHELVLITRLSILGRIHKSFSIGRIGNIVLIKNTLVVHQLNYIYNDIAREKEPLKKELAMYPQGTRILV